MAIHAERDEHEIRCPRCGGEAEWSYTGEEKSTAEILCPNCGRLEMSREDFDEVTTEHAELTEPE
jgi:predicted RNA-binding Zn-ribbon protein involved in translation (DUF1610 family)